MIKRPPGTFVVPTYTPQSLFANQTMAFAVAEDWKKLGRIQREGPTRVPPPLEEWQWKPTLIQVAMWLDRYQDQPCSWDFETTMEGEPVCLGAWSCVEPTRSPGICIPFLCQGGGRYWTAEHEGMLMQLLRKYLANPAYPKIGHNLVGFDFGYYPWNTRSIAKKAWNIDVLGVYADTMSMHHTAFAELRHRLAFLASMVTDLPPFKLEVWENEDDADEDVIAKPDWVRILERPDVKTRAYNLSDCFATALAYNVLAEELA